MSANAFLVGGSITIADIALHAYTHCASEAGFDLVEFPCVAGWLSRLQLKAMG